jgi:hypothetical protein
MNHNAVPVGWVEAVPIRSNPQGTVTLEVKAGGRYEIGFK